MHVLNKTKLLTSHKRVTLMCHIGDGDIQDTCLYMLATIMIMRQRYYSSQSVCVCVSASWISKTAAN